MKHRIGVKSKQILTLELTQVSKLNQNGPSGGFEGAEAAAVEPMLRICYKTLIDAFF